jgi:hypothetical protein
MGTEQKMLVDSRHLRSAIPNTNLKKVQNYCENVKKGENFRTRSLVTPSIFIHIIKTNNQDAREGARLWQPEDFPSARRRPCQFPHQGTGPVLSRFDFGFIKGMFEIDWNAAISP